MYVDSHAIIYASDASGNKGAKIINCKDYPSFTHWTGSPLSFDLTPGTYIIADVDNSGGGAFGISLQDSTDGSCLQQIGSTYPSKNPLVVGHIDTGCWIDLKGASKRTLRFYLPKT